MPYPEQSPTRQRYVWSVNGSSVRFMPTPTAEPPKERLTRFGPVSKPLHLRLAARIEVQAEGCWLWVGKWSRADGYGRIGTGSKADRSARNRVVHRVLWELIYGLVPEGQDLDHQCHNQDSGCPGGRCCLHRRCVNPQHLLPRTRGQNLRAGRGPAAEKAMQTHCIHGHEFNVANTYIAPNGTRKCRRCRSGTSSNMSRKARAARRDALS